MGSEEAWASMTSNATSMPIPLPTPEQQACWDHMHAMLNTRGAADLVVNAVAGSGKTFTAIRGAEALQLDRKYRGKPRLDIRYLAFNKSVQAEMQQKAGDTLAAQTFHSFGLRAITSAFGRQEINKDRMWKVLDRVEGMSRDKRIRGGVVKLIRLVKQYGYGVGENWREGVWELVNAHGLELADPALGRVRAEAMEEEIVEWVPRVLEAAMEVVPGEGVDFDDMIWLPYAHGLALDRAELLIVDEAQDLNRVQQWHAVNSGDLVMVVGDKNQAIYRFRGADSRSMDRLGEMLGEVVELPLTVTRRCPTKVVELAQRIVPQIRAWEGAGEGVVGHSTHAGLVRDVVEGDMVLCRVNAPLVALAFELLRAGKPARIRGREVHEGIVELLRKAGGGAEMNLGKVLLRAEEITQQEMDRFNSMKEGRGEERAAQAWDRWKCLEACASGCVRIGELTERLEELFREDRVGVVLSSVHKAKGLESDRVWVIQPEMLGRRMWRGKKRGNGGGGGGGFDGEGEDDRDGFNGEGDSGVDSTRDSEVRRESEREQYQQELNLAYVAVTRAKAELRWVGDEPRVFRKG